MRVHPAPLQQQINTRFRYGVASSLLNKKQLRRLPHIFAKVLELPFHSNADVLVHETSDSLRFVITTDDNTFEHNNIRAHSIDIHPGITKVVVRGGGVDDELLVDEMDLDVWRFRLPDATLPELASAAFSDGELVVVVPKGGDDVEEDVEGERWSESSGQFVLVH
ncbi:uncharacterized protein LOC141686193 [Apium graveolens]|uniref:uncharacterized protein LOC141686193 n=1 Tax=Apium graveolens TaxID=4045 RepID=UPI003D799F77